MIFIGDTTEEGRENLYVFGILAGANSEALFATTLPVLDVGFAHLF